jgi:bifunctional non-homologous end joining protein LigD
MTGPERIETELDGRRLSLSNLDKVLYPRTGFTKGDLIAYYVSVGPAILPHLARRPATFTRYPDGVEGESFFEKNIPSHAPPWVRTVRVPRIGRGSGGHLSHGRGGETIRYAVLDDLPSLAWSANLATIELHVPMWRVAGDAVEGDVEPDTLVLDLDPGSPATIVECCQVALALRPRLEALGLSGVAKTSGRKGLQVYAPLRPPRPWADVHGLALELARSLEADSGGLVISNMRRGLREGRVLVDWSQNHPAKTTVAPYSLRALPSPAASTPVSWAEVESCAVAGRPELLGFEPAAVLERLERFGDLFAPLAEAV